MHHGALYRRRLVDFQIGTEFFDGGFRSDPILRAQRIQLSMLDEAVRPADAAPPEGSVPGCSAPAARRFRTEPASMEPDPSVWIPMDARFR